MGQQPVAPIPLRPYRSAAGWAVLVALLIVWPVLAVGTWITQGFQPVVVVGASLAFLLFAYLFLTQDVDLVPGTGGAPAELVRHRLGIAPTRVPLDPGASVALERSGGGIHLVARHGSRAVRAPLAWASVYVRHSRDAGVLRAVADVVEPSGADGAGAVASTLRAQANHVERGGAVDDSPLATRVTRA